MNSVLSKKSPQFSDEFMISLVRLSPLETLSTTFLPGKLDSALRDRQGKGPRNSVFPRCLDVYMYVIRGKL